MRISQIPLVLTRDKIDSYTVLLSLFPGSYVLVWQKGDDVLTAQSIMVSADRRFKLLPDHTLELRNINPRDGGDYSCKISVMGDPIEITHTLEILRKSINPATSRGVAFTLYFLSEPLNLIMNRDLYC